MNKVRSWEMNGWDYDDNHGNMADHDIAHTPHDIGEIHRDLVHSVWLHTTVSEYATWNFEKCRTSGPRISYLSYQFQFPLGA